MPLINCPYCGHKVSDLATACPRCGRQLQPQYGPQQNQYQQRYYQQEPGLKSKNNNNTVIIVLSILVAALAIGVGILFGMMGCERNSSNGGSTTPPSSPVDSTTKGETKPPVDAVKDYDTTYVKIKQVEKIQVPNPPPPEPQEYIPEELNGYYITSGGGYGAYLRRSPSTQSTKLTVYRDGTYFEGAYSSVPRWIMVIKNGHIVGYIHDENVTPSEYYVNDGC